MKNLKHDELAKHQALQLRAIFESAGIDPKVIQRIFWTRTMDAKAWTLEETLQLVAIHDLLSIAYLNEDDLIKPSLN